MNLNGKGIISESKPNYGAIVILGSDAPDKTNFSTISVGKNITLEGWSGIFINHYNNVAYGILVNMNGTINAINDTNGSPGAGIYVNGNIKNKDNAPIINLGNTTKINSTGNGIYSAGYAIYNINGAYIEGIQSGLGIKSGIFNILNGTIIGSGKDETPTTGNNNGINSSGAAIQIESNPSYKGNIELNIKNGNIKSINSNVIYEYTVNTAESKVKNINISGGTFNSLAEKNVFELSNSFKNKNNEFISGGKYSSNPKDYIKNGYSVTKIENNLYEVTDSIGTFNLINNKINNFKTITIITILLIIISLIFINIKKNIKKIKKLIVFLF